MRVWDVDPRMLCVKHLLGEHYEMHAIWAIHRNGRKGYSRHPEVLRWKGKLAALKRRHDLVAEEMDRRGYNHHSALEEVPEDGEQTVLLASLAEQVGMLRRKRCPCPLEL